MRKSISVLTLGDENKGGEAINVTKECGNIVMHRMDFPQTCDEERNEVIPLFGIADWSCASVQQLPDFCRKKKKILRRVRHMGCVLACKGSKNGGLPIRENSFSLYMA